MCCSPRRSGKLSSQLQLKPLPSALTYICPPHTYVCMRTSVHIPDELLAEAKLKAAKDGRTLTSLIEEGLRLVVRPQTEPARRSQTPMPISTAGGGLRPGIDPVKLLSGSDEMDDLEMLERISKIDFSRP